MVNKLLIHVSGNVLGTYIFFGIPLDIFFVVIHALDNIFLTWENKISKPFQYTTKTIVLIFLMRRSDVINPIHCIL